MSGRSERRTKLAKNIKIKNFSDHVVIKCGDGRCFWLPRDLEGRFSGCSVKEVVGMMV